MSLGFLLLGLTLDHGLTAHHGDDHDGLKSGAAENFGAFIDGGTGGEHVIDEDGPGGGVFDVAATCLSDDEGTTKIFQALQTGESRLMFGGADALEAAQQGESCMTGEDPGDFLGLIEMAVLLALMMQRHGNERPFPCQGGCQPWVGKRFCGEASKFLGQMKLPPVFQAVNDIQSPLIPDGGRPGEIKGEVQFVAIRTIKLLINPPWEDLTTFLAKGFCEAGQVRITEVTQGPAV